MKRWLLAGGVLLLIQIVVAVTLNITDRDFGAFTPRENLFDFSSDEVNRIAIAGPDRELVMLKKDGEWKLPDYFGALADLKQIKGLLDKLTRLKQGLVVATSEGAAERFKVDENDFERHVVINNGDKVVADFYTGTSPGFKKVYARVADRRDIVGIPLNNYDLEDEPEDWFDQGMLKINEDRISELSMGGFELSRTEDAGWQFAEQDADGEPDRSKAEELVSKIAELSVKGLTDATDHAGLFGSESALSLTITLGDGEKREYTFAKAPEDGFAFLKLSGYKHLFKLDRWRLDELAEFSKEDLLKDNEEEKED